MDLDELKKSWNTIDEHLKKQQIIDNENIEELIKDSSVKIGAMSRYNYNLRIASIIILSIGLILIGFNFIVLDIFYLTLFAAAIPALIWDTYGSRYFANTKIDEQPIAVVISRFNTMHRWMIRERIIGIVFVLLLAIIFFIVRKVWEQNIAMISTFVAIWVICLIILIWTHSKNLNKLSEIRKNLNEINELKE